MTVVILGERDRQGSFLSRWSVLLIGLQSWVMVCRGVVVFRMVEGRESELLTSRGRQLIQSKGNERELSRKLSESMNWKVQRRQSSRTSTKVQTCLLRHLRIL